MSSPNRDDSKREAPDRVTPDRVTPDREAPGAGYPPEQCEPYECKLPDYATGRLPRATSRAVDQHLNSCASCRRFLESIHSLYQIELLPEPVVEVAASRTGRGDWWVRHRGIAAAILLAVVLWLVLFIAEGRPLTDHAIRSGASSHDLTLADLPGIALELPPFPASPRSGEVITDPVVAARFVAYTGKPLLEEIVWDSCPRCQMMDRKFELPEVRAQFFDVIHLRSPLTPQPPGWLTATVPREQVPYQLPAMRITRDDCASGTIAGVAAVSRMTQLLADFDQSCSDGALRALDDAMYHDLARRMVSIPALVDQARYAEAVVDLERVEQVGVRHRTAFVDLAYELRLAITDGLTQQLQALERHAENRSSTSSSIRAVAGQLAEQTRGLAIANDFTRMSLSE